jgi:predicted transcriptional regulator
MQDALISIKPKYVHRFLSGEKTIEIRRRRVNLAVGTRLWIYSTMPEGSISAVGVIKAVDVSTCEDIWAKYSSQMGITYDEFCAYVYGAKEISAINIDNIKRVFPAPTLANLRRNMGQFYPPQFFVKINKNNKLWDALQKVTLIERDLEFAV